MNSSRSLHSRPRRRQVERRFDLFSGGWRYLPRWRGAVAERRGAVHARALQIEDPVNPDRPGRNPQRPFACIVVDWKERGIRSR